MKFTILDTLGMYRRLQAAPDSQTRADILRQEIAEPFEGMMANFGGGGLDTLKMWGVTPDALHGENGPHLLETLEKLAAYDAWNKATQALEDGWQAFAACHDRIPTREITFGLLVIDMSRMPGQSGYSGFGAMPGYIIVTYGTADDYTLPRIQAATVHELHHNLMFAARPTNFMTETTVADYMLIEGLAESFAAELYGEALIGDFVTGFDHSRLEETKAIFRAAFDKTGFTTIRSYIFGDEIMRGQGGEALGVPAYAGYALGYHTVQAYLKRSGKSVAEATFTPTAELIAESGFFA